MQNQHPIIRAIVRLCGVRNHRPVNRQRNAISNRDYPPAMMPLKPNDKLHDGWYWFGVTSLSGVKSRFFVSGKKFEFTEI